MILVTYRQGEAELRLEVDDGQSDALLVAADRRFLPPWSGQDEVRFRAILERDEKRREGK